MNGEVPGELTGHAITAAVGDEVRRTREELGLSRREFVALLPSGIGERTMLAYEHGLRQLTLVRLAELSWALGVEAPTIFARALQNARLLVESIPLVVDVRALLDDQEVLSRVLTQWARNMLNHQPDGIVEIEPAGVLHLAMSVGYTHHEVADHLAALPQTTQAVERRRRRRPE